MLNRIVVDYITVFRNSDTVVRNKIALPTEVVVYSYIL